VRERVCERESACARACVCVCANMVFATIWASSSSSGAQFHQHFTYSYYARRSQMCKKRQSSQQCHLAFLGPTSVKAARKTLVKWTPGSAS